MTRSSYYLVSITGLAQASNIRLSSHHLFSRLTAIYMLLNSYVEKRITKNKGREFSYPQFASSLEQKQRYNALYNLLIAARSLTCNLIPKLNHHIKISPFFPLNVLKQ